MTLTLRPQLDNRSTILTVIDEHTIDIDGDVTHFPPELCEFIPQGPILSGHRDDAGELHLSILVRYTRDQASDWETKGPDGRFRGELPETWGPGRVL